jgi:RIO kinase 1
VQTLTLRRLFDFVTDYDLKAEDIDQYLQRAHEASQVEIEADDAQDQVEERVFKDSYIPRTLDEVIDIERDVDCLQTGDTENLLYTKLTGLDINHDAVSLSDSDEESDNSDDSDETGDFQNPSGPLSSSLSKEEIKRLRKENKIKVKAEKKERRKTKTPKHVKKRRDKLASSRQ